MQTHLLYLSAAVLHSERYRFLQSRAALDSTFALDAPLGGIDALDTRAAPLASHGRCLEKLQIMVHLRGPLA